MRKILIAVVLLALLVLSTFFLKDSSNPVVAGIGNWVWGMVSGSPPPPPPTPVAVQPHLTASPQAPGVSADASLENAITQMYREILGREPDPEGLKGYLTLAQGGMSIEDMRKHMASSDEARQRQSALEKK
jgi:hypothetical protein